MLAPISITFRSTSIVDFAAVAHKAFVRAIALSARLYIFECVMDVGDRLWGTSISFGSCAPIGVLPGDC